jgi:hypothetical protein
MPGLSIGAIVMLVFGCLVIYGSLIYCLMKAMKGISKKGE